MIQAGASHRTVLHPNFRLVAALRDVLETHQEHVINGHKTLSNLPTFVGRAIDGVRALRFSLGQWQEVRFNQSVNLQPSSQGSARPS